MSKNFYEISTKQPSFRTSGRASDIFMFLIISAILTACTPEKNETKSVQPEFASQEPTSIGECQEMALQEQNKCAELALTAQKREMKEYLETIKFQRAINFAKLEMAQSAWVQFVERHCDLEEESQYEIECLHHQYYLRNQYLNQRVIG